MKQLFTILLLAICSVVSNYEAQAQRRDFHENITGVDTIANAGGDTTIIEITHSRSAITFETVADSLSGTPAGTIYLEGTIDTSSLDPGWKLITSDTLVDQSRNVIVFTLTVNSYVRYRLRRKLSGTQSTELTTYLMYRRED